ncbi:MAG: hypothetical protein ACM3RP_07115 [Chitinophagales bacterium]
MAKRGPGRHRKSGEERVEPGAMFHPKTGEADSPLAPCCSPGTQPWDDDAPVRLTKVRHTEMVIGKLCFEVTTIIEHDEQVAERAERFLAECLARHLAKARRLG